MQKITTCLWFDDQAEPAAKYYVSVFKDAKINNITRYPKAAEAVSGKPAGSVLTVEFELAGRIFVALNGGKQPGFELNGAISFIVACDTQVEIDHFWSKLSAVPAAEQCGWCTDKFGITWQIVPAALGKMLSDPDQNKVERVMKAFLPMKKLVISELEKAYEV